MPTITSGDAYTVREGTTAVVTLAADDDDTPATSLTWSTTGGADSDAFSLSSDGTLAFSAAKDYENPDDADSDGVYEVTVQVSDGTDSDTVDISVTLENVIELAAISGPATVSFPENAATRVATYLASSAEDRDGVEWILTGDDASRFSIDNPRGVLRFNIAAVPPKLFAEPPDFEAAADSGADNSYEVTLQARVGTETSATLDVTVTVTDEDEPGTVTLSTTRPAAGQALTAALSDPDGVTVGTTGWQWERSVGRNRWAVIGGAASAAYTPVAADTSAFLRVTATYDDEHGTGHTAQQTTSIPVLGPVLSSLTATTSTSSTSVQHALLPAFDAQVLHYRVSCGSDDTMTVTASASAGARIAVNGVQAASGIAARVAVTTDSDVDVTVSDAAGAATTYVVHCIADQFTEVEVQVASGAEGVMDDLMATRWQTHITVLDRNAVPRFRREIDGARGQFEFFSVGDRGDYRWVYARNGPLAGQVLADVVWSLLDESLELADDSISTSAPLRTTDGHDMRLLDNGSYLLVAYEPAQRDFSHLTFTRSLSVPPEGVTPWSESVETEDSAIQIVTPDGRAVFNWNSWGVMPLEDCVQHRFPSDYAHINSVQYVDGVIVASFRGCSRVLGIDAATAEVLWRVGRSNLSDAQWSERGTGPAPMRIVGDPEGEFCGLHESNLLPNGNLLLYDNGVECVKNPWTGQNDHRQSGEFSRAVEYDLDFDNNEAVFVRDHSLHGTRSLLGYSNGRVFQLDNEDWLISWGRASPAHPNPIDRIASQVDPATGAEKWTMRTVSPSARLTLNLQPVPPQALAPVPGPLAAELPASSHSSVFHSGSGDSVQVVVAFSRPVADFDETSPSLDVSGATVASVKPHAAAGEAANAYAVTLEPDGDGAVTFGLLAGKACSAGGICAADSTVLSETPAALAIRAAPTVTFERAAYSVAEGGSAQVWVRLSAAHRGVRAVSVPVSTGAASTAGSDDFSIGRSSTVVFEAGETRKPVTVEAYGDDLAEGPEIVVVEFGSLGDGLTAGSTASSEVTITDSDEARIGYTSAVNEIAEGGGTGSAGGGGGGADAGVATFVIANGWSPADVGTASVLAARSDGAVVLYTAADALPTEVTALAREALPARVTIVGGSAAVSSGVRGEIRSASADSTLERVAGADRAATAATAARRILGSPDQAGQVTLIIANGWSPPDIGTAAALAASSGRAAVLYTRHDTLPEASAAVLRDYDASQVIVVGGAGAVSDRVQASISDTAGEATFARLAGADRVATAAAAARRVLGGSRAAPEGITLVIANGWSPPDIGTAAALAAADRNAAVAYTEAGTLPDATTSLISDYRPARVVIIGGRAAVSDAVRAAIAAVTPPHTDIRRITGATRTETAAAAARHILANP